jgi:hypothetical protein
MMWTSSGVCEVAGWCENGNELSICIKVGEFLDYMSKYQHFKKDYSPSSHDNGLRVWQPEFDSWQGQSFLFSIASRLALGPTQSPIQCIPVALSPGVKRLKREADHSFSSSTEVKNGGAIPPLPHIYYAPSSSLFMSLDSLFASLHYTQVYIFSHLIY